MCRSEASAGSGRGLLLVRYARDFVHKLFRSPDELTGAGTDYGMPLGVVQRLAERWRTGYDWRAHEARLNQTPQYTTTIDGQDIHFLHVRSEEPAAVPLLLLHGWPGSVLEFAGMIGPLTDPRAHDGDPSRAFHVVVPSLPGYGFSGPTTEPGWDSARMAKAFAALMSRLGYARWGAGRAEQGTDGGRGVPPGLPDDPDLRRAGQRHHAVHRVRPGWSLRLYHRPRSGDRGPAGVLRRPRLRRHNSAICAPTAAHLQLRTSAQSRQVRLGRWQRDTCSCI